MLEKNFQLIIFFKASFHAPFTELALSPEGCSSYTFPKIMGKLKATEILLFNKKLTASEAYNCGLVNEIIESNQFEAKTLQKLEKFSKIAQEVLNLSKIYNLFIYNFILF